jgi:hypothetical protein
MAQRRQHAGERTGRRAVEHAQGEQLATRSHGQDRGGDRRSVTEFVARPEAVAARAIVIERRSRV